MPASKPKPKAKIRPFRKVPITRISNSSPEHVYLENDRFGVKIPLKNQHGLLQGVFETPEGDILEIRFAEGYPSSFHVLKNDERVGYVSGHLTDRIIRGDLRRKGVATAVFDRAEPAFVLGTKKRVRVFTQKEILPHFL